MIKKLNINGHYYDTEIKKGSILCYKGDFSISPDNGITWGIVVNTKPEGYENMAVEVLVVNDELIPYASITGGILFERAFFHNPFTNVFTTMADYLDFIEDNLFD